MPPFKKRLALFLFRKYMYLFVGIVWSNWAKILLNQSNPDAQTTALSVFGIIIKINILQ